MEPYSQDNQPSVTMRDYVRVLFRQRWVVLTAVITVCAVVYIGLQLKTKQYTSTVKMLITAEKQVDTPYYRDNISSHRVEQTLTQSEIVRSKPVIARVVRALSLDRRPPEEEKKFASRHKAMLLDYQLKGQAKREERFTPDQRAAFKFQSAIVALQRSIGVQPVRDTNMFAISVTDYNPVMAAITANVVSRSYIIYDLEQQLAELRMKYGDKHPLVMQLQDNIFKMMESLDGQPLSDLEAMGPASVKIIEQASVPLKPSGTPKTMTMLLAIVMSIFLGVMLAFIFEYGDQTFKLPGDIEQELKLPVIGSLKRRGLFNREVVRFGKRLSRYGRSYAEVGDQLYLMLKDKQIKTVLVPATVAGERNSTVMVNVSNYFARMLGLHVLVIDANLRKSTVHRLLKKKKSPGLAEFLNGDAPIKEIINTTADNGPEVITAGQLGGNPVAMLESTKMQVLMEYAKDNYDVIFVDVANMRDYKDTAVLSPKVDGVILVLDEGRARRQVVKNATSNMNGRGENILGVILNRRTYPIPKFVYDSV